MNALGAGLAIAGAGAVTLPAILAALGIKIGALGVGSALLGSSVAGSTSLLPSLIATAEAATTTGAFFATSAKMLIGGVAVDFGTRLMSNASAGPTLKRQPSVRSIGSAGGDMSVRDFKPFRL